VFAPVPGLRRGRAVVATWAVSCELSSPLAVRLGPAGGRSGPRSRWAAVEVPVARVPDCSGTPPRRFRRGVREPHTPAPCHLAQARPALHLRTWFMPPGLPRSETPPRTTGLDAPSSAHVLVSGPLLTDQSFHRARRRFMRRVVIRPLVTLTEQYLCARNQQTAQP